MTAQVALRDQLPRPEGLRSRKKAKTRLTIEDAALALFEQRGFDATTVEQIAELAEVSTTTFFRYFPSKAEVVLINYGEQLPALHRAILERPLSENDLVAVRRALEQEWVSAIDPERTARKAQVIAMSDTLRGKGYERGTEWLAAVTDALARRRRVGADDERCALAARVALSVLASAVEGWIAGGSRGDFAAAFEHRFDLMTELCDAWSDKRSKR